MDKTVKMRVAETAYNQFLRFADGAYASYQTKSNEEAMPHMNSSEEQDPVELGNAAIMLYLAAARVAKRSGLGKEKVTFAIEKAWGLTDDRGRAVMAKEFGLGKDKEMEHAEKAYDSLVAQALWSDALAVVKTHKLGREKKRVIKLMRREIPDQKWADYDSEKGDD